MTTSRKDALQVTDALAAERCVVELQRGREVALLQPPHSCAITLVETLTPDHWRAIRACQRETGRSPAPQLIMSGYRARILGRPKDSGTAVLDLPADISLSCIRQLAGLETLRQDSPPAGLWQTSSSRAAAAAMRLAQQAHALPALLMFSQPSGSHSVLNVSIDDACRYSADTGALIRMSRTRIPLTSAASVELVVFKERHGSAEHVAITVGHPDRSRPVVVRLHSSCFTGDILGSLRCDCGEQLTGAISSMARAGGGVVLYVSQEGRGIGLASKLRAYQLQDEGLDTIEANQHLGFGADERSYQAATTMLHSLGIGQVRLMTNNPQKIDALRREGVDVVGRLPSHATVNVHNARYLRTKRERAGHLSTVESVV